MVFETNAEREAEEFVDKVKGVLERQDDLIYGVDSSVKKSNVLSPNTVNNRNAWVEVRLHNVNNPRDALPAEEWIHLGRMGADVDFYDGDRHNDYTPSIEIHKRFG